jgi:DNA-directed RNA polymerase subunit beta'
MKTTIGSVLFNAALPAPLRDYQRVISKKNISDILTELADKYPQHYASSVHEIKALGDKVAYKTGHSVSLDDFRPPPAKKKIMEDAQRKLKAATLSAKTADEFTSSFAKIMNNSKNELLKEVLKDGAKKDSGLAEMIFSGSRGSPGQLNSIVGSPMAVSDSQNRVIPIPIINSFAQGLDPAEYWASSYGTRKGVISTKVATAEGGYFGKRLAVPVNRIIVTIHDCDTHNGIREQVDGDILDTYLAKGVGPFKRNTMVTRSVLDVLSKKSIRNVLIRSPISCEAEEGVCALCRGIIETGKLPEIGSNVGVASAMTIAEPVAQGAMDVKHKGGALEDKHLLNIDMNTLKRLVDIPKTFPQSAVIAEEDGKITSIVKAPQGGTFINVGETQHIALRGRKPIVKLGDKVTKGDPLSDGIINPSDIVRLKGIGPGRVFFTKYFKDMYKQVLGKNLHQKHFETFARGLINYVKVDDAKDSEEMLPGDYIPIAKANRLYKDEKSEMLSPAKAKGMWLTKPYLHYSVGAEVTAAMVKDLTEEKILKVSVSTNQPGFEPQMIRLDAVGSLDPDWMHRLGGERLKTSLLKAVKGGQKSYIHGTSFIPGLAYGQEFGETRDKGKY